MIRENDLNEHREGMTVLVVDDSALIRERLVSAFLSAGFETCGEAENGKQAIEVAKQIKPDVITLDPSMPVMNGLEAAPLLRKTLPQTPIILFTLYADSLANTDMTKTGISLVLEKNTSLRTLIDKTQELLRN